MIWKYRQVNTLPRLAWCLQARRGGREVRVLHGPWVETQHDGFVEGAWDGAFTEFDFDQATFFVGSGARRKDAGIVVVTPSNSLEAVFVARRDDLLLASNSLVFLLDQLDDAPQPTYPLYALRFRRLHRGSGKGGRRAARAGCRDTCSGTARGSTAVLRSPRIWDWDPWSFPRRPTARPAARLDADASRARGSRTTPPIGR